MGDKVIEWARYIPWVPFYQEWKPRVSAKNAHPWSKGVGSWFKYDCHHVKRPTKEAICGPCLLNRPNQRWTCANIGWERFFCEKHEGQNIAWCHH